MHHHHFQSYHDDKDSLHAFTAAFYPDHIKLDTLIRLASAALLSTPFCEWTRTQDTPEAAVTLLIADPPQSRAPPIALFT